MILIYMYICMQGGCSNTLEHYVYISLTFGGIVCDIKGSFQQYLSIFGVCLFILIVYTLILGPLDLT